MNENLELPGLPPIPKKRGRPSTGKALTAAQRKRNQRIRATMVVGCTSEQLQKMPITSLLEQMAQCFSQELEYTGQIIAQEILRRAKLIKNSDSHENE